MLISQDEKGSLSIIFYSGVQRPTCAEFCIKTEGNPGSGTTETENGRKEIP